MCYHFVIIFGMHMNLFANVIDDRMEQDTILSYDEIMIDE